MRHKVVACCVFALHLLGEAWRMAWAQDASVSEVAPQEPPSADVVFESVLDLKQDPGHFAPRLRGGTVARSTDWPASLYVTFPTSKGTASCTAALVGPRAMLTAAHCVPTTGNVSFKFGGKTYEPTCERHPDYASNADPSADYALCRLADDIQSPAGFRYETIDATAMKNHLGQRVVLTGYGCVSDIVGAGPSDKKYRFGSNVVEDTSESALKQRGPAFYFPKQVNNLITRDDVTAANLCPGDSGGPTFRLTPGGGLENRTIVGVNSRVFYRDATHTTYGASLISGTGGPDFGKWAEGWAKKEPLVAVCGVFGAPPNCRN